MVGKQHIVSFACPIISRKIYVLDHVYTNVYGPLRIKTPDGSVDVLGISDVLYFVTFIDIFLKKFKSML